ncbi:MAG: hypothetical protein J7J94_03105 [Thaumarchaeota archaeon]|nr:hypothetical protein [Nitrososphaerota archaeon]
MCEHRRLIYLGAQKAEGGYNHYFKCLECGAVIVKLPSGKFYQVGGSEIRHISLTAEVVLG